MTHSSKSPFLEEEISLLVKHFGIKKVQAALAKVVIGGDAETQKPPHRSASRVQKPARLSITTAMELIRGVDPEKHHLLSEFLGHLKDSKILPDSQDIRHFAQLIGLKDIKGKSRKDMIPTLMRFLLEQPLERLQIDLQRANNISEHQRRQGFSVLTDKLLGGE